MALVIELHALRLRLANVNAQMQSFSTSPVLRTKFFRQMLPAPQLIRVGLSCAKVS